MDLPYPAIDDFARYQLFDFVPRERLERLSIDQLPPTVPSVVQNSSRGWRELLELFRG